ncbi:MAG: formylglycine-generating enzyme family protein, partial [bacterium]|nr:formylglycine-generating enzyme family protein [bacterium]
VLLRAVARKVEERWASAEEFRSALRRALTPRIHEKDGSVLVYVPGGEFTLGTDEDFEERWPEPEHRVILSAYWIGKYPVTNAQYARFLEENPDHPKPQFWSYERFSAPQQPVVGVSWLEAQTYCRWAGLELPTEAQWEAAARGTDGRPYPWGSEAPTADHADFDKSWEKDKPDAVGRLPPSAWLIPISRAQLLYRVGRRTDLLPHETLRDSCSREHVQPENFWLDAALVRQTLEHTPYRS